MSGFSLIELMVVTAIVGVLVATVLPSLANARIQAQQTACASNERQMGVAIWAYASDFKMYAPVDDSNKPINGVMPANGSGTNGGKWAWLLTPYINHIQSDSRPNWDANPRALYVMRKVRLYQCPSTWGKLTTWNINSYGANPYLMNMPAASSAHLKRIYAYRLTSPAATRHSTKGLMISESIAANSVMTVWHNMRVIEYIHNGRSNTLLFDGHVESLPTNEPGNPYFLTTTEGSGVPVGAIKEIWGPVYSDPNP